MAGGRFARSRHLESVDRAIRGPLSSLQKIIEERVGRWWLAETTLRALTDRLLLQCTLSEACLDGCMKSRHGLFFIRAGTDAGASDVLTLWFGVDMHLDHVH